MASFPNMASAEARPRKIDRPVYFGSHMDPASVIKGSGDPLNPHVNTAPREVKLPPGVDLPTFTAAIKKLRAQVGHEWVELNDIVKWANDTGIPLWPISIGRNLGYGGSAPRVAGSLIVHLGRRMDKVISVDPDTACCLLEPGVSYFSLYEHLNEVGLGEKLWVDVPDLGGGSDHFAQHCGMEIVMPTGEVVRTGMMAMSNSQTDQAFNYGFGPYIDGMFTQSNLGIVTKMGMWLMPSPGGCIPFMCTFPEHSDLEALVNIMRPLMVNRQLHNIPGLRLGLYDTATYQTREEAFPGMSGKPITPEMEKAMLKKRGAAAWYFYAAVYGPEHMARPHLEFLKSCFMVVPGAQFFLRENVSEDHYLLDRAKVFAGVPTFRELDWQKWIPNSGTMFFSPISPVDGKEALAQVDVCKARFDEYGFDLFDVLYVGPRELHHICILLFDKTDPEQRRKAFKCIQVLIEDHAKLGYGEYRTHIALQDQVMETYNYNDSALLRLHEKMKDGLDPRGIMAPGRSGVWPASYRGKGYEIGTSQQHAETPNPVVERILKERASAPKKRTYGTDELLAAKGGKARF
ncbi:hypothetical protein RQP46_000240 [Phenoliferia psychrophenolica]